jgi:ABC-type bacteriocin/lantibiotic exporter with double-glycine peptidase domain
MFKRILSIIILISSLSLSNAKQSFIQKSQCGINALYLCLRYHEVNVSLDQVYNEIKTNKKNEVNLYQLSQYAKDLGLYSIPIKHPNLSTLKKK